MGRVRTKTVKGSARKIIEKYYSRLTLDFQTNKRVCDEVAEIPSKRMRNKIAGYVTVRRVLCALAALRMSAPHAPHLASSTRTHPSPSLLRCTSAAPPTLATLAHTLTPSPHPLSLYIYSG
tara:strand:- start:609 stop:971 length:363 start_codon:yes stop_codon:yes gene_type:complete